MVVSGAEEVPFDLELPLPLINRIVQRVVLLRIFDTFLWVHVLPEILEQPLEVVVCACGDWPTMGLSNGHVMEGMHSGEDCEKCSQASSYAVTSPESNPETKNNWQSAGGVRLGLRTHAPVT